MSRKIVLSLLAFIVSNIHAQINDQCFEKEPICTNPGITFTAIANGVDAILLDPGNNYGCLASRPNPTWFYFDISVSGSIGMNLSASSDIDFIIWGPFANLSVALAQCGNMGNGGSGGGIIDCSYSASNNEFPNIPNAIVGEIYVILITNYASVVQDLTLLQVSGAGATDCASVDPTPCNSEAGSFTVEKNGVLTNAPIYLCAGDDFEIISNNDYVLQDDIIPQPVGDGIYSTQLMWLVYDTFPASDDPSSDPGFLNLIIPDENLSDINDGTSPIISGFGLGCGTYYFVPVTADDGVGGNGNVANGSTDNGGLHWDKNGNDCYSLGDPVQVIYSCSIQPNVSLHCNPPSTINGIDVQITGGIGFYTIVNQGEGNLISTAVINGGTAHINNLENNQTWEIDIVDGEGCGGNATGVFVAPVFSSVSLIPAVTCPLGGSGTVNVSVNVTSGNGAPYSIVMATDPPTSGTSDSHSNLAGQLVNIVVSDNEGCIADSTVTITSSGHFINIQVVSLQDELCYGEGDGSASISAVPTPSGAVTSITWTGPSGQHPGGNPGGPGNSNQSGLEAGYWIVTVIDNTGCDVSIAFTIESPQQLQLHVTNLVEPYCYGFSDGSYTVQTTGGEAPYIYNPSNTMNGITAGSYWAHVTDNNGCIDSLEIILDQPDSLYADFTIKNILCWGDSTGAIIVEDVGNDIGNIAYFWNLGGVLPNPPFTSNTANGLPSGIYVVTIQDAVCSNQYEFTLTQNPELLFVMFGSTPLTVGLDGVVYCDASGGIPGYTYTWTNLGDMSTSNSATWSGLDAGIYAIEVMDTNGCVLNDTLTLGWLGNKEISLADLFKIYPTIINDGQIHLLNQNKDDVVLFAIYDMSGKIVFEKVLLTGENVLELLLSDGPYIYQVSIGSKEKTRFTEGKIIVITE